MTTSWKKTQLNTRNTVYNHKSHFSQLNATLWFQFLNPTKSKEKSHHLAVNYEKYHRTQIKLS